MQLTITKIRFMHGKCSDAECPVCHWRTPKDGGDARSMAWNKKRVTAWLKKLLTVQPCAAKPDSPWWNVKEEVGTCYRKLRGDLRPPGFYDSEEGQKIP
jgi:hypothetical protein